MKVYALAHVLSRQLRRKFGVKIYFFSEKDATAYNGNYSDKKWYKVKPVSVGHEGDLRPHYDRVKMHNLYVVSIDGHIDNPFGVNLHFITLEDAERYCAETTLREMRIRKYEISRVVESRGELSLEKVEIRLFNGKDNRRKPPEYPYMSAATSPA